MAHMILDKDAVVTRQGDERAWHNLDRQHDFASMSDAQIITALNMYHTIDVEPLSRFGSLKPIKDVYGWFIGEEMIRQRTDSEQPIQPAEFAQWCLDLYKQAGADLISGGTLKNRNLAFTSARLSQEIRVTDDDTLYPILFSGTAWDGTHARTVSLAINRPVCWNTLPLCFKTGNKKEADSSVLLSARISTKPSALEIDRVCQTLEDARCKMREAEEVFQMLANAPVDITRSQSAVRFARAIAGGEKSILEMIVEETNPAESFLDRCVNATINMAKWESMKVSNADKGSPIENGILSSAVRSAGSDLSSAKDTTWGLLNGATAYFDHVEGRESSTRSERVVFADDTTRKQNVVLLASAMANTPNARL